MRGLYSILSKLDDADDISDTIVPTGSCNFYRLDLENHNHAGKSNALYASLKASFRFKLPLRQLLTKVYS